MQGKLIEDMEKIGYCNVGIFVSLNVICLVMIFKGLKMELDKIVEVDANEITFKQNKQETVPSLSEMGIYTKTKAWRT